MAETFATPNSATPRALSGSDREHGLRAPGHDVAGAKGAQNGGVDRGGPRIGLRGRRPTTAALYRVVLQLEEITKSNEFLRKENIALESYLHRHVSVRRREGRQPLR